jgi:hypothetical protein
MAFHACRGIDPPVDLVLIDIISPVRQGPFNGILVLVAWFQLILMSMAIGAERIFMADGTGPVLLPRKKPMPRREIACVVHRRLPVSVAVPASRRRRYLDRVPRRHTGRLGAGIDSEERNQNK